MTHESSYSGFSALLGQLVVAGIALCSFGPATARAALIVSVDSGTVSAGSSNNAFDVELTNTGPASLIMAGFSFGISTINPNISFTNANIATAAPYIFGANSLFGPDLTGPNSGQTLNASDIYDTPGGGISLGAGVTLGIGHVLFDVASGATPGTFAVTLAAFPLTSLADNTGADVPIDTLLPGQITIEGGGGSVIPEPSTLLTFLAGAVLLGLWFSRAQNSSFKPN